MTFEWHHDAMVEDEIISVQEMKISQGSCYVETQFINQFIHFSYVDLIMWTKTNELMTKKTWLIDWNEQKIRGFFGEKKMNTFLVSSKTNQTISFDEIYFLRVSLINIK